MSNTTTHPYIQKITHNFHTTTRSYVCTQYYTQFLAQQLKKTIHKISNIIDMYQTLYTKFPIQQTHSYAPKIIQKNIHKISSISIQNQPNNNSSTYTKSKNNNSPIHTKSIKKIMIRHMIRKLKSFVVWQKKLKKIRQIKKK